MGSERKYSIEHITHREHPLIYSSGSSRGFLCDGCNKPGNGSSYRCVACDFDLHDHCATCPTTFSFAVHPSHELSLVFDGVYDCDVCGTEIDGLQFYRCELCNFSVHPLCTQLPEHTRHPLHPDHLLRLQPLPPRSCRVCETTCITCWGYGCQVCDFYIHLPCVINPPLPSHMSSFLDILMRPITVFLVFILATLVFIIMSSKDPRYQWGYSVHSVYFYR